MRKLVAWNLMTLDGYFEGQTPWDLGFHLHAWGPELHALSLEILGASDLLVFGRRTYEGMAAHWTTTSELPDIADFMNGHQKLVASRSLNKAAWSNSRVTSDPVAELTRLKQEDGKAIYVFGSADLLDSLLGAGLVDEYMIGLVPVVLGAGNPLFKPGRALQAAGLAETRTTQNGTVVLRYRLASRSADQV